MGPCGKHMGELGAVFECDSSLTAFAPVSLGRGHGVAYGTQFVLTGSQTARWGLLESHSL